MVSFSCEVCNDVVKKPKLDSHKGKCRSAYFTCIDCNTTFNGGEYKGHTSCISEAQKYQGTLYKPEKGKGKKGKQVAAGAAPATETVLDKTKEPAGAEMADVTPAPVEPGAEEKPLTKEEKKEKANKANKERKDRRKAEKEGKSVETEEEAVAAVVEEAKEKEIETIPKKKMEDKKERKGKKEKKGKEEKEEKKRKAEEPKEVPSLAKKDKKEKKDKRKIEEVSSEPATVESGEKKAPPAKKPKREKAPEISPEDQAIGTAFLALFQKGHPLTFSKALARLEKKHGVDAQKKLFAVLRLKKVKEDVVLSVI